ncbi:MAG: FAD-binding protein [Gemmatimonas sp.]|nr:FAD-binding protein [Gemmatimonas sp.]
MALRDFRAPCTTGRLRIRSCRLRPCGVGSVTSHNETSGRARMSAPAEEEYDAIVIGSGFGGCLAALPLVEAGASVLMLERGDWVVRGEHNWREEGAFVLTPHYTTESAYARRTPMGWRQQGLCACVGGPSVFYGGASFRFREADFDTAPEISTDPAACWPLGYAELEPFYGRVEKVLGIAGEPGVDPTEPARSQPYGHRSPPLATVATRIAEAANSLGLRPFRIPMAIDAARCHSCTTCDAFACAVSAKNDLATRLIPGMLARGMVLRPSTVVTRLGRSGSRVAFVDAVDAKTEARLRFRGELIVLAAGALATPHLLLASGLQNVSPGGSVIGRYLMRHCNAMTYGFFRSPPNAEDEHHKQLAIHDFYFGDPRLPDLGKLGNIQQVMAPPTGLVRALLPKALAVPVGALVANLTGLLVIAEDQPRSVNRVEVDSAVKDRFGLPGARIRHRYSRRDFAARAALVRRAREILRRAGSRFSLTWNVSTFSHAVGTVRMGNDARASALDRDCRFRGIDNLWVTDGSVFPTSGGVNPSLTIAANALRVGTVLTRTA